MNWWKNTVVYQIYPKSFYDANNDGVGDLKGIIKKIPYLEKLGIGAIWISPFFKSPMVDNGYDVADYKVINPLFGNMKDFDQLIKTCNKSNIKVIVDFVVNHTSDQHAWFKKALKGETKYQDYYYFRKNPIWEKKSVFGGEAWKKINDKYYLHSFAANQPDLNWNNKNVRQEFVEIMNYWIDKGIGGIRFDVIDEIGKILDANKIKKGQSIDIKKLHQFIQEWRKNSKWVTKDLLTVGESWDSSIEKAILYTNSKRKELAMIFGFEHILVNTKKEKWNKIKLDLVKFKEVIARWQTNIYNKGWLALFLSNHDLPRMISNFGDDQKYRVESGKCLALTIHMLQGTPFIYQGEEIGMTNCVFNSLSEHNDVEIHQLFKTIKSKEPTYSEEKHLEYVRKMNRDNARTPMQWNNSKNGGFTKNNPWLKVNQNYQEINVDDALKNKDSLFYWYQKLIKIRKDPKEKINQIVLKGKFELIDKNNKNVFAYKRTYKKEQIIVIANWTSNEVEYQFDQNLVTINSYDLIKQNKLLPWQALVLYQKIK